MAYFDARGLPPPELAYVAWVDVMGIQSHMQRSISVAANFIYKLHAAALESPHEGIALYPMMDGFYATCVSGPVIEKFLRCLFCSLAAMFIAESKPHFRFIAKGAIAHGQIYHGRQLAEEASFILAQNKNHRDSIVLGVPVVDANATERLAPPFGLAIHDAARVHAATTGDSFLGEWWHWFGSSYDRAPLRAAERGYYDWCRTNVPETHYDRGRVMVHEALALRYLDDDF